MKNVGKLLISHGLKNVERTYIEIRLFRIYNIINFNTEDLNETLTLFLYSPCV